MDISFNQLIYTAIIAISLYIAVFLKPATVASTKEALTLIICGLLLSIVSFSWIYLKHGFGQDLLDIAIGTRFTRGWSLVLLSFAFTLMGFRLLISNKINGN